MFLYIQTALTAFELNADRDADISLFDNDDVNIPAEMFELIVFQYENCSNFKIRIQICSHESINDYHKVKSTCLHAP